MSIMWLLDQQPRKEAVEALKTQGGLATSEEALKSLEIGLRRSLKKK